MRIALVLPSKEVIPKHKSRLKSLFSYLDDLNFDAELITYSDAMVDEVGKQLLAFDVVLVWVNPIHEGRDRSLLDAMLDRLSAQGVFVSTRPDVIVKMGTKEVLFTTRDMPWGGDIYHYQSPEQMKRQLPANLQKGSRVLKQYRGNGGLGVWRVELLDDAQNPQVRVIHAIRGSVEERMPLSQFYEVMGHYGQLIDQPYISPHPGGMIRAYMSLDQVVGFGHQYVTALIWPPDPNIPLNPDPRLYYPKDQPEYQSLRQVLEGEWIKELQEIIQVQTHELPMIWDADFLIRPDGSYVLCEINMSSVFPFPEYAIPDIVDNIFKIRSL